MFRGRRSWPARLGLLALALILAAAVAAGGGLLWLRESLPQTQGRIAVAGLDAPVEVLRDERGVPTIRARNDHDAYFALGFVHAQDRLWQMEVQRRSGQGRLSEIFGEATLSTDRYLRTFGTYRLAEASLAHLGPDTLAALDAYAEGVNAFLAGQEGPLPPEFVLLGHRPEPWRRADSLVWGRLMAIQLSGNWMEELRRARVIERVGPERAADLWAESRPTIPTTVEDLDEMAAGLLEDTPALLRPRLASNVWALSGERTTSGKPLLANDPHLGFQAPVLWYLANIETPDWRLSGATVPGVPFHLIGHNDHIAWGFTSTHSDTMDLFVERPVGGASYLTPQGPAPFEEREETIRVKGGEDRRIVVRSTRHGPVVSDLVRDRAGLDADTVLALSASLLVEDDRTAQAIMGINRARDWPQFVAALRDFHSPQQNIAFAATDGTIGLYTPGRVPVRAAGDGTVPRPGWTGAYDWLGWIPFESLPHTRNPEDGDIVNANNQAVPDGYPHLLAARWPDAYRAVRIEEMLDAAQTHDAEDMRRMQMDIRSPMADEMLALLAGTEPRSPGARDALAMLADWDRSMDRERPEPLILLSWLHGLQRRLIADDLGELADSYAMRLVDPRFLRLALTERTEWCDDAATPAVEGCAKMAAEALEEAAIDLAARHGEDMDEWRWGDVHVASFPHPVFSRVPGLDRLFALEIATGGGDFTVNRGTYNPMPTHRFAHSHGAGLRAVFDLSDLTRSRFIVATGQSGNVLSPHWGDMLTDWRDGRYLSPAASGQTRLILEPKP